MASVTIDLLARSACDAPFSVVGTQTVQVGASAVDVTPTIPAGAAGQELAIAVTPSETIAVAVATVLHPEALPEPRPLNTDRRDYGAWGGARRQVTLSAGQTVGLAPAGVRP
ncbi:hypothetical protein ACQVP2_28300 [Methylobacterium aquaticum]|uniref:hypothetical protein n=1 Tax=Methylobacterium aquaticum TaxID=270351 RepID=UPI003D16B0D3